MSATSFAAIRKAPLVGSALLLALLIGLLSSRANSAPPAANEYELKAAFVYNLLPFVEWPQSPHPDRLVVGVAGEGPLGSVLSKFLSGKRIGARSIQVHGIHSRTDMRSCDVVVFTSSETGHVRDVLQQLQGTNALTVGNGEEFAASGGIVAFIARDNRLQLAINQHAAERAGIRLSSKLLSMARLVSDAVNVPR